MKRLLTAYCGSGTLHVALFAWLAYAAATIPVQISFERGRASIELQATIAAAPKPTVDDPTELKLRPTETARRAEPPPPVEPAEPKLARRLPTLPEARRAPTEPLPQQTEATEVALSPPEDRLPEPRLQRVDVEPPLRRPVQAMPRRVEAPVETIDMAASQAENGAEFDELPQPHPLNRQPRYPPDAYARRRQGTVVLELEVRTDGTVGQVRVVLSSGFFELDEAARTAATQWRFTPAKRRGMSVAMPFEQRVNFSIGGALRS